MAVNLLVKGITVTNDFDSRGQAILGLFQTYIPGIVGRYYGFRSLGTNPSLNFPCVMVCPKSQKPEMYTTGKYRLSISYSIYVFLVDSDQLNLVQLQTYTAEAMKKLFSQNALADGSNRFKQYPGYWINSEMNFELSEVFIDPFNDSRYMRTILFRLDLTDVAII